MNDHIGRAFAVHWSEVDKWNPGSFRQMDWKWPREVIRPLSVALRRRIEVVDRAEHRLDSLTFGSLHFTGELSVRDMSSTLEVKGKLCFAHAKDVVYSKIDARNGAIGIVPESVPLVVFSSEFPIYEVDTNVALPEYVKLLFRMASFRERINSLISGASGRKRVEPSTLEGIEVPLPTLSAQRVIVEHWRKADDAVRSSRGLYTNVCDDLNTWLYSQTNPQAFNASSLVVGWEELETWNVQNARAAVFKATNPDFVPLSTYAEESTLSVKPSLDPEHDWPVYGVNNQDGVFFSHYQKGSEFKSPYKRIQKDWFFHNPTRSAVGSLGHVPHVPDDAITSPEYQVWKLKDRGPESLPPGFVETLIQTKWFVNVIQFHRVGTVKQRLYVDNLLSIPVPRFPRQLQQTITAAREQIADKRAAAAQLAATTASEVEEMILGQRLVPINT